MSTFLTVLAVVLITQAFLTTAVFVWLAVGSWLDHQADQRRREQQGREMSLAWIVGLSSEPTPIYDALVCERIEKAEGWSA